MNKEEAVLSSAEPHFDAAVERLRLSKAEWKASVKECAEQAGAAYVLHNADYEELNCLERWQQGDCNDLGFTEGASFIEVARILANNSGSEGNIDNMLRQRYGDDIDDPIWIETFIDSALSKFQEIKPKL